MQSRGAFFAISTPEKIAAALFKWITGNRGFKRKDGIARQVDTGLSGYTSKAAPGRGNSSRF